MTDRQARLLDIEASRKCGRYLTLADVSDLARAYGQPILIGVDMATSEDRTATRLIWYEHGVWFHGDETGIDRHGPYTTEKEAREGLNRYVQDLFASIGLT